MSITSVHIEQRDAITIVTINRPERRNALDSEAMSAIGRSFADAANDDSVAAIVLTGTGDVFCAGMDLRAFSTKGTQQAADGPGVEILLYGDYPKPVIAAANGSAHALGFELLLACDLVVAAEGATFSLPEVKRGLVAAGGGILRLPQFLPLPLALELGLTGEAIDATRAHGLGLLNRVVPADAVLGEALRLAQVVASNAPLAVRFTKEHMRRTAGASNAQEFRQVGVESRPIFGSEDAKEGARAFAERRAPVWTGR